MSTPPSSNSQPEENILPNQEHPDWAVEFVNPPALEDTPLQHWTQPWSPEDPNKPSLPYLHGLVLQIDRHVPPGSFEDNDAAPVPHLSDE